jgi:hypothetical protein
VRFNRKSLLVAGLLLAIGAAVVSTVIPITYASNCGGNSAALFVVSQYATIARMAAEESADRTFRVAAVTTEQREQLAHIARYHWIPNARFLVSTTPLSDQQSQPRRIIAVCDTPYCNVPQHKFGWWTIPAPATHAAAFSDGSTALISTAEFAALDRLSFRFLDELYPTK